MSIDNFHIITAVLVGAGATLIMDLWSVFLRQAFNISSLSFCLVGRWLGHMLTGKFKHDKINLSSKKPAECILGWAAHYLIGIVFAFILVIATSSDWLEDPTILPALLTGLVTLTIPFLIMQPSMGLGIAAAKTPAPTQARLKSAVTHLVFSFGLYVSACGIGYIQAMTIF